MMSVLLLLLTPSAQAALNTWGVRTDQGTVALVPYVYAGRAWTSTTVGGSIGLSRRTDLYLGGYLESESGEVATGLDVMGRFFLWGDALSGVVHAVGGRDALSLGPELHLEVAPLTVNAGWSPNLSAEGSDGGLLWAYIAGDLWLGERFGLFAEVDPYQDLAAQTWALEVVPGINLEVGDFSLSAGVGVQVAPTLGPAYVGAWIWHASPLPTPRRRAAQARLSPPRTPGP